MRELSQDELRSCCASTTWMAAVAARQPYADLAALVAAGEAALAALDWADIKEALAAHPRIGERAGPAGAGHETADPAGTGHEAARGRADPAGTGHEARGRADPAGAGHEGAGAGAGSAGLRREAAWSRSEQSGTAGASPAVLDAIAKGNAVYEERFGHVYLVRATGRSAEEMLGLLLARLANDEESERTIVRAELAEIVRLRLQKAVTGG
ncbi:2-oxo-4-hydroxy-4-carboxy-5-ureidoimidazoline decarboxylase [Microtetraspora niveoalba]|uniref:2-oxo-4-hydroxy-4-carboxy-5-ureidoimidazoline decarboxylase n=1 Tax=Microtetraspora niveoalba TaxID=46175 RepID=UPI0008310025|nr:2-oxo-4-hydroxy-4-carboxy-5-ureidoimidazoline decarboxylase [Microtetraspora niveoalba]